MKKDYPSKWLKQGEQSKITKTIKDIAKQFSGTELEKIKGILNYLDNNIRACRDNNKVIKIFATRTATEVLKDGFSTGCHDTALLFVTFCRAVGIPAKYVVGINKFRPRDRGHVVAEIYLAGVWVLVDPSPGYISLYPERSAFYAENFLIGKGYDSWDVGIKSFKTWVRESDRIIGILSKI